MATSPSSKPLDPPQQELTATSPTFKPLDPPQEDLTATTTTFKPLDPPQEELTDAMINYYIEHQANILIPTLKDFEWEAIEEQCWSPKEDVVNVQTFFIYKQS